MNLFRPSKFQEFEPTSRRARKNTSGRRDRLKLIRRQSTVETLEQRCLLTIYNLQTVPLLTPAEGSTATNFTVATFADPDPIGNLSATVTWGAGVAAPNPATTTITAIGTEFVPIFGNVAEYGVAVVSATFGESTGGLQPQYTVAVTDTTAGANGTTTALGTVQVVDATLSVGPGLNATPISTSEGEPISFTDQFSDADPLATIADFTATIDWGDGSPQSAATITGPTGGPFNISGTHTYDETGTYTIQYSIKDVDGSSLNTTQIASPPLTVNVADAPLGPGGPAPFPLNADEGQLLTNIPLGTFSDFNPLATQSDFLGLINWGDGSPTDIATFTKVAGVPGRSIWLVTGSHTYQHATGSPFTITVAVSDVDGSTLAGGLTTTATIIQTPLAVMVPGINANAASSVAAGAVVGSFSDNAGGDPLADYTASFNWGDGTTFTTGGGGLTIVAGVNSNTFNVVTTLAHTYAAPGLYPTTLTVNDSDPAQGIGNGFALVAPAAISPTSGVVVGPIAATEGSPLPATTTVASFTVADPAAVAGDFHAEIDWGDGSPTSFGTIVPNGVTPTTATFLVQGGHTYAEAGSYTIKILFSDNFGTTVTTMTSAVVADAPLSNGTAINVLGAKNQPLIGVPVAVFVDGNPLATPSEIIASINWGDGTPDTPGVVTAIGTEPNGSTIFQVSGSHTYTTSVGSPFTITVDIADVDTFAINGGVPQIVLTPTATISSSPIGVTVLPISTSAGAVADPGDLVATFTDPAEANLTALPGPITASINWGDSTAPDTLGTGVTIQAMGGGVFGVFAPAGGHTYALPGLYIVTVTVNDSDPSSGVGGGLAFVAPSVIFAVSATPVPGPVLGVLTPGVEGQPLVANTPPPAGATGVELATFTDTDLTLPASSYSVLIDWGDGSPQSTGEVTPDLVADAADPTLAHFVVTGEHTYAEAQANPYTITVFVTQNNPPGFFSSSQTVHVTDSVEINDAPLTAGVSLPIFATVNVPLNDVPVATFIDANPDGSAGDFTATINWGDGTGVDPNARIVETGGIATGIIYTVYGSHDYKATGNFATEVTVQDEDPHGSAVAVPPVAPPLGSGNVTVENSPIEVTGLPLGTITIDAPTALNLPVATFIDTGSTLPVTDYSASINWGDGSGTQSFGAGVGIVALGGGQFEFDVPVQHTYTSTGTFPITVTIADSDPATGVGGSFAIVIDSIITATPVATPIVSPGGGLYHEGQALVDVPLATLTDTDTSAVASDYTVQIDWGDGSPQSEGIVVPDTAADAADPSLAHFFIEGSHTYAETNLPGYTVQLIVTDAFGGKTTATDTIGVADAPLSAALGLPIFATEYQALNDIPVATFVDANSLGSAGDFSATINWGDGSALDTNARIALVGANPNGPGLQYAVYGSHEYTSVSTFHTEITVQDEDPGGSSIATTPGTVTVSVAPTPLVIAASPVNAIEGIALPNGQSVLIQNGATPPTIVATFYDTSGPDPIGDYSALIDWGNGGAGSDTITAGTIVQNGTNFVILAPAGTPIVYPDEGSYSIRVALFDSNGGTTAYAISPVTVADAKLTAGTNPTIAPTPVQGQPLPQTPGLTPASTAIGTFTDANPLATPQDFTVTIDWGDGTAQTAGYVTQTGETGSSSGLFTVSGNHTYVNPSTGAGYPVTIYIKDDGGSTLTLTNNVTVTASTITVTPLTFHAVEGQPVINAVVAYFSDSSTPGPLTSYSAVINWNDASPATVTPGQIVPLGGNEFEVLGSLPNGYPEEGTYNVFVTVDHNGVPVTNPSNGTTSFTATAKVADAPLTSQAIPIVAVEGAPFTGTVAYFNDLDPNGMVSDYTVTINWGDGTTSGPLAGSSVITQPAGPGTQFVVTGTHTYKEEGAYTFTVTITDAGGSTTTASALATVADAALVAANPQPTVAIPENVQFSGPVATFRDLNPFGSAADFSATIDWGDGGPDSVGTVVATATPNVYEVLGTHTYANVGNTINGSPGAFTITTTIHDDGGSVLILTNSADVTVVPIVVTGQLNPSSDTGESDNDGVTDDNQPNFFGTSTPFSHVRLYATPIGASAGTFIGQTQALSDGSWSITSGVALHDGTYTIAATGRDQANLPVNPGYSLLTVATNGGPNVLTIDTVGPRVTNATFDRADGMVSLTFSDYGGSGLNLATLEDAANYAFNNQLKRPLGKYIIGAIYVTPGPGTGTATVDLSIVSTLRGAPLSSRLLRGFFQIAAYSANVADPSGIQDVAGNSLDGEYYGAFPSGNGVPGGSFIADFNDFHNIINPPATVLGTPHPNNVPANFVAKPTKAVLDATLATKVKVARVTAKVAAAHAAHDLAIESVFVPKTKKK